MIVLSNHCVIILHGLRRNSSIRQNCYDSCDNNKKEDRHGKEKL